MRATDSSQKRKVSCRIVNLFAVTTLLVCVAYIVIYKIQHARFSQQWANNSFHNLHFFSDLPPKLIDNLVDKPMVYRERLVSAYYVPTGFIRGNLYNWHNVESIIVTNLGQYHVKGSVFLGGQSKNVLLKFIGEKNNIQAICIEARCYPLISPWNI